MYISVGCVCVADVVEEVILPSIEVAPLVVRTAVLIRDEPEDVESPVDVTGVLSGSTEERPEGVIVGSRLAVSKLAWSSVVPASWLFESLYSESPIATPVTIDKNTKRMIMARSHLDQNPRIGFTSSSRKPSLLTTRFVSLVS